MLTLCMLLAAALLVYAWLIALNQFIRLSSSRLWAADLIPIIITGPLIIYYYFVPILDFRTISSYSPVVLVLNAIFIFAYAISSRFIANKATISERRLSRTTRWRAFCKRIANGSFYSSWYFIAIATALLLFYGFNSSSTWYSEGSAEAFAATSSGFSLQLLDIGASILTGILYLILAIKFHFRQSYLSKFVIILIPLLLIIPRLGGFARLNALSGIVLFIMMLLFSLFLAPTTHAVRSSLIAVFVGVVLSVILLAFISSFFHFARTLIWTNQNYSLTEYIELFLSSDYASFQLDDNFNQLSSRSDLLFNQSVDIESGSVQYSLLQLFSNSISYLTPSFLRSFFFGDSGMNTFELDPAAYASYISWRNSGLSGIGSLTTFGLSYNIIYDLYALLPLDLIFSIFINLTFLPFVFSVPSFFRFGWLCVLFMEIYFKQVPLFLIGVIPALKISLIYFTIFIFIFYAFRFLGFRFRQL
jgi:hypothetical protein